MTEEISVSNSNVQSDRTPKEENASSKKARDRSILATGAFVICFGPVIIGLVFGWWLAEVLKFFLGTGLFQFLVVVVCLVLFTCWVYKKGFDAGRK